MVLIELFSDFPCLLFSPWELYAFSYSLLSVICRKFLSVVGILARCQGHSVPLLSESPMPAEGISLTLRIRRFAMLLEDTSGLFISFCWLHPRLQEVVVKNPTSLWLERLKEPELPRQNSLSAHSTAEANPCSENKESLQCLSALFSDCTHVGGSGSLGRSFWTASQLYFHQCILKNWFHISPGPDSGGGELLIIPALSIPKLCIFN